MRPQTMELLSCLCATHGLVFAIDEALTAIRCGAPFTYQRTEYSKTKPPDLVFFGKALGLSGIGIDFGGAFARRFSLTEAAKRRKAIISWQGLVTRPVQLADLIEGLGILEMAVSKDWVARSRAIGGLIRQSIKDRLRADGEDGNSEDLFGGLECLIFVRREIATRFLVMSASLAGPWVPWVRWMPKLDEQMTDRCQLERYIFGSMSGPSREKLATELEGRNSKPLWCFWCGRTASVTKLDWCRRCCINICDVEACVDGFLAHKCL